MWQKLRDLVIKQHKAFLQKHNGVRPRQWESLHCAVTEETVRPYLEKWDTVKKCLR